MFGGIIGLIIPIALVVVIVRAVQGRSDLSGGAPDVSLRRFFHYLVLLGLLIIVAMGSAGLLAEILPESGTIARRGASEAARALTFTVIGGPLLIGMAFWTRRRLAADPNESESLGWAFYLTVTLLIALGVTMTIGAKVLHWALSDGDIDTTDVSHGAVWAIVWVVHWMISQRTISPFPLSENLTPEEMVEWLNEVYSAVDAMVTEHGVEKIRTIGDGYMCAAGVPVPREDHATILTNLALAMKAHFEELAPVHGHKAEFRIGINSGPVVGGVIGTLKFQYDIWGTPSTRRPAWNLMESRGGSTFHPRLIFSFKIPMCASRAGPSRSREKAQWRPGSSRHRSDPDTASCPAGYPKQPLGSSSQAIHHVRLGRNARRPPGLTGSCMGY